MKFCNNVYQHIDVTAIYLEPAFDGRQIAVDQQRFAFLQRSHNVCIVVGHLNSNVRSNVDSKGKVERRDAMLSDGDCITWLSTSDWRTIVARFSAWRRRRTDFIYQLLVIIWYLMLQLVARTKLIVHFQSVNSVVTTTGRFVTAATAALCLVRDNAKHVIIRQQQTHAVLSFCDARRYLSRQIFNNKKLFTIINNTIIHQLAGEWWQWRYIF